MVLKGGSLSVREIKLFMEASYKKKPPTKINSFQLDEKLSNEYAKVYVNERIKKIVVVHRGTDKTIKDWSNNAAYALNDTLYKNTDRFKISKKTVDKALKKYKGFSFENLGHSQGSLLARETGEKALNVIQVNPAMKTEKMKPNEYIIRGVHDIVSASSNFNKLMQPKFYKNHVIEINNKNIDILKNHSLNILDKLDQNKQIGKN